LSLSQKLSVPTQPQKQPVTIPATVGEDLKRQAAVDSILEAARRAGIRDTTELQGERSGMDPRGDAAAGLILFVDMGNPWWPPYLLTT